MVCVYARRAERPVIALGLPQTLLNHSLEDLVNVTLMHSALTKIGFQVPGYVLNLLISLLIYYMASGILNL